MNINSKEIDSSESSPDMTATRTEPFMSGAETNLLHGELAASAHPADLHLVRMRL